MEINGLPLHPLVVHAVVVFVPLAAVLGLAFAFLPKWRSRLAWPTAAGGVVALVLTQVAIMSGEDLQESRRLVSPLIDQHQEWGLRLRLATIVFAVLAVGAAWISRRPKYAGVAVNVAVGLVALAAVAVAVLAFLTGEAGARAVWGA